MGQISKLTDFESAAFCERVVVFDFRGRALGGRVVVAHTALSAGGL